MPVTHRILPHQHLSLSLILRPFPRRKACPVQPHPMNTLFRQCPMVLQSPESSGLVASQSPRLEVLLKRGIHTPTSSSSSVTQPSLAVPPRSRSNESLPQISAPLPQTSAPRPQPSRWNLSISRPSHTPKSSSRDRRRDETVGPYDAKPIRPDDSALNHGDSPIRRPKTIWSTDDSFLPRAKPPRPLQRISHERTRSAANVSEQPSLPDRSSSRASSKRPSSKPSSERLRPWSPSLDMPILDISSEHSIYNDNNPIADSDDEQHAFTRSANRMTVVSEMSEVSEICFSPAEFPSSWKWMPPSDWAGPSTGNSIVEEAREKSKSTDRQGSAGEKSPQSSAKELSFQVLARLNHAPSRKKLRPDTSSAVVDEGSSTDSCDGHHPASKVLKVKCYERNGWQEKRMADVIPILRKLKSK